MSNLAKKALFTMSILFLLIYSCDFAFRNFLSIKNDVSFNGDVIFGKDSEKDRFIFFEIKNIMKNDFPIVFAYYFKGNPSVDLLKSKYGESRLDALRHTYMAARLASIYPEGFVRALGEINELRYGAKNELKDMNMDLWNNDMGIKIGMKNMGASKTKLMEEVFSCLDKSRCIVDKDEYKNKVARKTDFFNFVFYDMLKKYNIVFNI